MAFCASTRKELICLQKSDLYIYVVSNPGLTVAVFTDPRIETVSRLVLEAIGRHTNDPEYRRNLERKLADYTRSREAAAEITAAIISAAVGAIAVNQMTRSVMSLGPAAAGAAAQSAAIAG